jgi:hypothetical protein
MIIGCGWSETLPFLILPNNKVRKGFMVWFFRRTFCKKTLPNSVNQPAVSLQIKLKNDFWGNQSAITQRSVVATLNGGVCRWDPLDPGEIHPPRRLAHGSGRRRSRRSAAHGRLAGVSRSSRPWRPAKLLPPSTASAQPDAGTHGRHRLERELRERSDMAAGRAPAAFSCLRSARHGEASEASPRLERELGECSAMA